MWRKFQWNMVQPFTGCTNCWVKIAMWSCQKFPSGWKSGPLPTILQHCHWDIASLLASYLNKLQYASGKILTAGITWLGTSKITQPISAWREVCFCSGKSFPIVHWWNHHDFRFREKYIKYVNLFNKFIEFVFKIMHIRAINCVNATFKRNSMYKGTCQMQMWNTGQRSAKGCINIQRDNRTISREPL